MSLGLSDVWTAVVGMDLGYWTTNHCKKGLKKKVQNRENGHALWAPDSALLELGIILMKNKIGEIFQKLSEKYEEKKIHNKKVAFL